jgi:hypothetical protein
MDKRNRVTTSSKEQMRSSVRVRVQGEITSKGGCRMDLPGPTTSVGTRTDYSVGPWDYSSCATQHLMAWGARTTMEKYSDKEAIHVLYYVENS